VFQNQYINMGGAGSGFLKKLVDLLIKKSKELDDFRMILRSDVGDLRQNLEALKKRGLDLRKVRRLPRVHTKGIVVDGQRVLLGSHNWSGLGVTLNRDASLIFDDEEIAKYYLSAFEIDWKRANRVRITEAVEAPRIADPESSPAPGYRRMTLAEYLDD
jgi:phosphatidylserine/phosphatidylglycerophosphate/cardiolipin synthase-like enzyme